MIRRYQNEIILALSLLLLLIAIMYRSYSHSTLISKNRMAEEFSVKIEDIATMKKLWQDTKNIPKKLEEIKGTLSPSQIEKFKIDKKKAEIILMNLTGSQLNKITGKQIASVPVQIDEMSIDRNGDNYRLELKCKW